MRSWCLSMILIGYSSMAWAQVKADQELRSAVQTVHTSFEDLTVEQTMEQLECTREEAMAYLSDEQQCVEALCGGYKHIQSPVAQVAAVDVPKDVQALFEQHWQLQIKKLEAGFKALKMVKYDEALKQNLKHPEIKLMQLAHLMSIFELDLKEASDTESGHRLIIKPKKNSSELSEIVDEAEPVKQPLLTTERNKQVARLLELAFEQLFKDSLYLFVYNSEQFLQKRFPGDDLKSAYEKYYQQFKLADEQLKLKLGSGYRSVAEDIPFQEIERMRQNPELDELRLEEVMSSMSDIIALDRYQKTKSPEFEALLASIDMAVIFDEIHRNQALRSEAQNKLNNVKQYKSYFLRGCYDSYRLISALPNKAQINDFKAQLPNKKQAFLAKVGSRYSEGTRLALKQKLDGVFFQLPSDLDLTKAQFPVLMKEHNQALMDQNQAVPLPRLDLYTEEMEELVFDFMSACNDYAVNPNVSDQTHASSGKVRLSFYHFSFPEFSDYIVSHELGHNMEALLASSKASGESRARFNQQVSCLSDLVPDYLRILDVHDQSKVSKTFSEDYADLVAFQLLPAPGDANNRGCLLNLVNPKGVLKTQLFQPREQASDESHGIHSEDFFRILHEHYNQHKALPTSCQQFLQKSYPDFKLKSCF